MSLEHMATQRTLSSWSRVQLLFALQRSEQMTAAELAQKLGLHHNTVREHLQRLVDDGFVVSHTEKRQMRGRPRVLYSVRSGEENEPDQVLLRKIQAAEQRADLLKRVLLTGASEVGPADSVDPETARQIDVLEDHLDQAGFEPSMDLDDLVVKLSSCPFHDMVREHTDMVCSVHFGLIKMTLNATKGPLEAERLIPFATPHTCEVHLKQGALRTTGPSATRKDDE